LASRSGPPRPDSVVPHPPACTLTTRRRPGRRCGRAYPRPVGDLIFKTVGFGEAAVDYVEAWDLQRQVHAAVADGDPGTVLLLEHPPVFTAGKRTEPHERPVGDDVPVIDVDRGGKITFHGPGQLVGYPIVRLPDHVLV